jgi:hypothetical protein
MRRLARGNLLRGAGDHDLAARVAALGSEIDHVIRRLDDVQVMLDQEHGVARIDDPIQRL